ncbi:MAG: putative phage abortive infection protein [Nitrosospira sp.]
MHSIRHTPISYLLCIRVRFNWGLLQPDNYFKKFRQRLLDNFEWDENPTACCSSAKNHYVGLFYEHKEELSHYFKILYRILKILDDSDIEEKEKFRYVKILRSQISENEMLAIYYNSHSNYGGKFYNYVLTYNFLKHLPSISKPEFKGFIHNKTSLPDLLRFNSDIYQLLSEFISQRDHRLKDEDFLEEKASFPLPQNNSLILGFKSTDYHELDIEISHPIDIANYKILDFDLNGFIAYFKFFVFDIFISSTYQDMSCDCITHKVDGSKVIFEIRSKSKLLLNVDRD